MTFDELPSWQELSVAVEELFEEHRIEDFVLEADGIKLSARNWGKLAKTAKVIWVNSCCKPFSSFSILNILDTTSVYESVTDTSIFSLIDYDKSTLLDEAVADRLGLATHGDVVDLVGKELAVRNYCDDPAEHKREASRRELISPVLFGAATLAGAVQVTAEFPLVGPQAKGQVDYMLFYKKFGIVCVEGKLFEDLEDYTGQLAAEMKTSREHFKLSVLHKRKHEDDGEFKQVPSYGILTNGLTYVFFKYLPGSKELIQSATMNLSLQPNVTAALAAESALPVMRRLMWIIQQQKNELDEFWSKWSNKKPKLAPEL
ncbi:hypothetical protein GPECTOR_12g439 [Gonium pectorale]|uniref:Uncharacterized protein n=1 Tax=Gonium pectorale TaxID=33097 RepID=A0A150GNP1_GONPE|nr:hypothetical protein GPECTOR_12g439 [Gonium pectorale]|eukprot:KXZ51476.1 hypothetical protein GPECTOR_12g439 [Gonium pectorale]